jgi:hypothetical protein
MPNRVYIAGPMRGVALYNFPAFDAAAAEWRKEGWEVVSPADMDRAAGFDGCTCPPDTDWSAIPPGFDFRACMRRCLEAVPDCLAIYMLREWEGSRGACAELAVARWAGLEELYQEPARQESILDEALRITSGARRRDYDAARPNHERIAALWNAYLGLRKNPGGDLSPSDVATCMLLLKLARHVYTPKRDNLVDIAGYARCIAQIEGLEETGGAS